MIDSVRFYVVLSDPAATVAHLQRVCDPEGRNHFSRSGRASYARCRVGTLRAEVVFGTLYVEGSWPTYFGIDRVDWRAVPDLIGRLEEELGMDLDKACVSRLEIYEDVQLSCSPVRLLACLDSSPRMRKDVFGTTTVAFVVKRRKFTVYDKGAERRARGMATQLENTARLELKIRRLSQVSEGPLALHGMGDCPQWLTLVDLWADQYRRIRKVPQMRGAAFGVNVRRCAELAGVLARGPDLVRLDLQALHHEGKLTPKAFRTRKEWLNKLLADEDVGEPVRVIQEVDSVVSSVVHREHDG